MTDDWVEAGWPPVFPPLLSGREVGRDEDPAVIAARALVDGADPGLVAYAEPGDRLRFAIALAPEVPLERAMQMAHTLMVAIGDSIGALAPPEVAVEYRWPTTILVNGAAAGRIRLAASHRDPALEPDWLVIGLDLRLEDHGSAEPGDRPGETTLYEEGSGPIAVSRLLESMSRHFLTWLRRWEEDGFRPVHDAWRARAEPGMTVGEADFVGLDEDGRALLKDQVATRADSLANHLEDLAL